MVIKLKGIVKEYDWGLQENSIISKKFNYTSQTGKFAELWFGTHPSGTATTLKGKAIDKKYGIQLPFLFKVLSVGRPLSIQTHPDKEMAKLLHASDPEHYPDPYPKPEVGIAISDVKLLYGFKTYEEIRNTPELDKFSGDSIKEIYQSITKADFNNIVKPTCIELYNNLSSKTAHTETEQEILKLQELYPSGDLGVLSLVMLNLVTIPKGQALFIEPNIPHAYLSGELIECMAPSDNVIRAGLTSKYIDIDTLLKTVDYNAKQPSLITASTDGRYQIPLKEYFSISKLQVSQEYEAQENELIFCLQGEGKLNIGDTQEELTPGEALLIRKQAYYRLNAKAEVFSVKPQ